MTTMRVSVLLCLLAFAPAFAQAPKLQPVLELHAGAKERQVRLLWIPIEWPAGAEGVQIGRRVAGSDAWEMVGERIVPRAELLAQLLAKSVDERRQSMLHDFFGMSAGGFASIQPRAAADAPDRVEYGLFVVMRGKKGTQPVATASLDLAQDAKPNVVVEPVKPRWKSGKLEAAFRVDPKQLFAGVTKYYVVASRNSVNSVIARRTLAPGQAPENWEYVCVLLREPFPRNLEFVMEDSLGFGTQVSMPLPRNVDAEVRWPAERVCDQNVELRGSRPWRNEEGVTPLNSIALFSVQAGLGMRQKGLSVERWADRSNGNDATAEEERRQPTLFRLPSGRAAVHFDGRQLMTLEEPLEAERMTLFVAAQVTPGEEPSVLLGSSGYVKNNQIRWEKNSRLVVVGPKSGKPETVIDMPRPEELHILTLRYDGDTLAVWRNTSLLKEIRLGVQQKFSFDQIGAYHEKSFLRGDVAILAVIPEAMSNEEIGRWVRSLMEDLKIR
jgi:hypothetical protein